MIAGWYNVSCGAMSRFEQEAALGSDISRIAEIWPHARNVIHAIVLTVGYAMEVLAPNLKI